jgi:phenylpyruvate tautomerase PptA (4-oxalocrotonate tautomerase family)
MVVPKVEILQFQNHQRQNEVSKSKIIEETTTMTIKHTRIKDQSLKSTAISRERSWG